MAGSLSPSNRVRSVITSWMSRFTPGGTAAGFSLTAFGPAVLLVGLCGGGYAVLAAAAFAVAVAAAEVGSVTRWTSSSAISWAWLRASPVALALVACWCSAA